MSRNTEYQFVDTDTSAVVSRLTTAYETLTGHTLQPSDPDKLFIMWVASAIIQERVSQNYVGNQNLPSRAVGDNLDALGNWIYGIARQAAKASKCTVRFTISAAQSTSIVIPSGTRVTDSSKTLVWSTAEDAMVEIGDTTADVTVQCETLGIAGNGYVAGQINTLIDVDNILYFSSCSNIDTSDGGSEESSDDDYFELMKAGLDAYSTAGSTGAYTYWAKSVSTNIADVKVIQPSLVREEEVTLFTANNIKHGFLGGERLITSDLKVYAHNSSTAATLNTDYTFTYVDGLLDITIVATGTLASQTSIDVEVTQVKAGCVYIYALMNDGTIADSVIKQEILKACNADTVRPVTDYVSCEDADTVEYNVTLTYYIKRASEESATSIEAAVTSAVNDYVKWQCSKIGRDINPSELEWRLAGTGIKRVVITSPIYTALKTGDDHSVPQLASVGNITLTNGGFEDE